MEQTTPQTTLTQQPSAGEALSVRRLFTRPGVHPFETVEWELRTAAVGSFRQENVEFPTTWSQNATNIVAQKYFRGQLTSPTRERSVKTMVARVAGTIADWGRERGYFASEEDSDAFEAELTHILLTQMAAFNSPVWFNVGFEEQPQCSACFILRSRTRWTRSSTGTRGKATSSAAVRSGSRSIDPSNMPRVDGAAGQGRHRLRAGPHGRGDRGPADHVRRQERRAAKMVVLDVDHPDIREFIWCKAKEEDKAAALRDAGFDMSIDGDGFHSIQYQNANNSVRVTDEFMHAVEDDADWHLIARTTGEPIGEPIKARELMREIAEAAWRCADPGVQYDTTINQWHTSPNSGRINASNPCSEYMHVDDSACNLASINLMKFRRPDGTFDVESFQHTVDIVLLAQEIVVSPSSYPTKEIGDNARAFRQLGLGYANLGAFLMANGFAYDSDAGRGAAAAITALMTGRAYAQSAKIAAAMGPYDRYPENRAAHNNVMRMHRDASYAIPESAVGDTALLAAARETWNDAVSLGELYGYRNAQASVLAPTGTISFLMDCDTTGIEPDFSLVKYKELVGGGNMVIANRTVPMALRTLGYTEAAIEQIEAYVAEHGKIVGAPGLQAEHLPVFDVAVGERAISHAGHIKMMGAVQPFLSGAISKTVNMPQTATVEDIAEAYIDAWRLGVKALAIYRDGSKTAQALRTDAQEVKEVNAKAEAALSAGEEIFTQSEVDELVTAAVEKALLRAKAREDEPLRKRMPRERNSLTHKFSLGGHEGYITAGMYPDGTVGEIFLTDIGKEGSTLRGMMNSFATAISISLQYGVPLETLVRKFAYMRFEPEGITTNPEIPFAKSMPDYIMRWLASRFLDADTQEELGILTQEVRAKKTAEDIVSGASGGSAGPANGGTGGTKAIEPPKAPTTALTDTPPVVPARLIGLDLGPACNQCGGMMQRTGSCYTCSSCGNNTGCG